MFQRTYFPISVSAGQRGKITCLTSPKDALAIYCAQVIHPEDLLLSASLPHKGRESGTRGFSEEAMQGQGANRKSLKQCRNLKIYFGLIIYHSIRRFNFSRIQGLVFSFSKEAKISLLGLT